PYESVPPVKYEHCERHADDAVGAEYVAIEQQEAMRGPEDEQPRVASQKHRTRLSVGRTGFDLTSALLYERVAEHHGEQRQTPGVHEGEEEKVVEGLGACWLPVHAGDRREEYDCAIGQRNDQ